MATLPEDVSDDLRLVIDELESAIADMESRLESTRAERDEAKARQVELTIENAKLFNETRDALERQTEAARAPACPGATGRGSRFRVPRRMTRSSDGSCCRAGRTSSPTSTRTRPF